MRLLFDDKPADGGDNKPAAPAAPASPKPVANTPLKHPAVIAMEKKVAVLEDKLSGLEGWQNDVNATLEGLNIGGPPKAAPVKVKSGNVPPVLNVPTPPPTPKSFGQIVDEDIWGNQKPS